MKPVHVSGRAWADAAEITLLAGAGVYAAGWGSAVLRFPGPALVAVVLAAGLITTGAAILRTAALAVAGFFAAVTFTAAGWLAYARDTTPTSLTAVLALLFPAMVFAPAGAFLFSAYAGRLSEARLAAETARRREELARFERLLTGLGAAGVEALARHTNRAGYVVTLRLPGSGKVKLRDLDDLAPALDVALRLDHGAVSFEKAGRNAANVEMHVRERDVLADEIPFPADYSPLTVTRPFPVGHAEDGSEVRILFRERHVLIVGTTGAGKSNLINVLIAQLARCVDTVVFLIDNKGGRVAYPWVRPWIDDPDNVRRPVIDWWATTPEETHLMLSAVKAAIRDRATRIAGGGEKLEPDSAQPQIVVIVDESAEVFGTKAKRSPGPDGTEPVKNRDLLEMATSLSEMGRSEAVAGVFSSVRGTVSTLGGTDLKAMCKTRFALGVASQTEAAYVTGDDTKAARIAARLEHAGGGILIGATGDKKTVLAKWYRLVPERITRIAQVTGPTRPKLDDATAAAMGVAYAERISRARPTIDLWAGTATADPVGEQFDAMMRAAGFDGGIDDSRSPARVKVMELLEGAGFGGLARWELAAHLRRAGFKTRPETISRWLADEVAAGTVERIGRRPNTRYRKPKGTQAA